MNSNVNSSQSNQFSCSKMNIWSSGKITDILGQVSKGFTIKSKLMVKLLFTCLISLYLSRSAAQNCNTEELSPSLLEEMNLPNCEPENSPLLCIRVKFHFLNNTTEPIAAPTDEYYFELFEKTNKVLGLGNLRITFDYNCIHRETLTEDVASMIHVNKDISTLINSTDPAIIAQLEYDPNSINIYTLQSFPEHVFFGSFLGKHTVTPTFNFPLFIHEFGHCLGLPHTFPGNGLSDGIAVITNNCKDLTLTNSNSDLLCSFVSDAICDTETDAYTFDVDGMGGKDFDIWLDPNTCTQKPTLLNSYADGCGNTTLPWKIPIKNFMSYYGNCRSMFTPCQYGRSHEALPMSVP